MKICNVENCGNKHEARGYCKKHYARWRRHGSPNPPGMRTQNKDRHKPIPKDQLSPNLNEIKWKGRLVKLTKPYHVTTDGQVFVLLDDGWVKIDPVYTGQEGRPAVNLSISDRYITHPIHRLVAYVYLPNPHGLPCVRHLNGDVTDNRVSNLRWGTKKQNSMDAVIHRWELVTRLDEIHNKHSRQGYTIHELATEYQISHQSLRHILTNYRSYRDHIDRDFRPVYIKENDK